MTETYAAETYPGVSAAAHVPHPGSRLDRVASAAAQEAPVAPGPGQDPAEPSYIVATRADMPEETIPRTILLGAGNPFLSSLPRDSRRRRAVLLAIDNDVVLAESKELAQNVAAAVAGGAAAATLATGFYLSKGIAIALESRAQMFIVATTTGTASRVSVVVERYADPSA